MTDTVLVVGPSLAGAAGVARALRGRLEGCAIVEPAHLAPGQIPDAVVFVTSAAAPMSDCDAALLAASAGRTDAVVAAVSKIDVHRTWRAVLDTNRTASARWRAVPWVGVAAEPEVGPVLIEPLVDAVRAELDDVHRRQRNLLRTREWMLQRRIAGHEREAATRATLRAQAVRRSAVRVRIQQARLQLAAQARAASAALRTDVQSEAAVVSRRGLDSFDGRVHERAQRVADEFDSAVAHCMAEVATGACTAVPALAPSRPIQTYLPPRRRAVQEDRLAAVVGTGFGIGVALTLGRFLAEVVPAVAPAVIPLCGGVGLALAAWVVRTRRLLTARGALDRWAAEVAAGLRTALEERALAAESALLEAHIGVAGTVGSPDRATAAPTVDGWIGELARVRAELDGGSGGESGSRAAAAER
jgi:hypothetical protein